MSRFSSSGTFFYAPGDVLTAATTVLLNAGQMPQYPFENTTITDRVTYRSKSGKSWMYENYNLDSYTFNWSLLDEPKKNALRAMYDSKGVLSFSSNGATFGTFRIADSSWSDSESAYELFDVSFTVEEVG
jgi:hypothetical protein